MKLKKLVSLALAGVLAVSMLAGCKANGSSSSSEQPTSGVNAASVIAALDKKVTDKITFSASASLQTTVEKAASVAKDGAAGVDVALLMKLDNKLSDKKLPESKDSDKSTVATDKLAQNYTFIVNSSDFAGASAEATAKNLADKIAKAQVYNNDKTYADLPAASNADLGDTSDKYKYEFDYTANVAVISGTNTNGQLVYYVVVDLTRTPVRKSV